MVEPPSDDYDDLTVDEVKSRVESGAYDPIAVREYEVENKDRVTLTRWLDDFITDWFEEEETVVVAPTRKRRVATFWIDADEVHEPMEVRRTPKVEDAIASGDFQVIER